MDLDRILLLYVLCPLLILIPAIALVRVRLMFGGITWSYSAAATFAAGILLSYLEGFDFFGIGSILAWGAVASAAICSVIEFRRSKNYLWLSVPPTIIAVVAAPYLPDPIGFTIIGVFLVGLAVAAIWGIHSWLHMRWWLATVLVVVSVCVFAIVLSFFVDSESSADSTSDSIATPTAAH